MPESPFENLEPRAVWAHFATLCAIPRPSRHEAALRAHLVEWAAALGLEAEVDAVGNLVLRKPASPGCAGRPGVVLQGHLDMVCQKNAGTLHDFHADPLRPTLRDGWLIAENTTLGADNGIGVALALAALEDDALVHPPLEVLLTVNEEAGMDGARGLAADSLAGQCLINLDTEEWGHFYLGCAGGLDVEARRACRVEPLPAHLRAWRLEVSGLLGGHSGIDIHLGRGNAIRLLVEGLTELAGLTDARLVALEGGSARNAIPREAWAVIALPAGATDRLHEVVVRKSAEWRQRFAGVDDGVSIACQSIEPIEPVALARADQAALLAFLGDAPNGVHTMSQAFLGVVETSDNLGVIRLEEGTCRATFLVRSQRDGEAVALGEAIVHHAAAHGLEAEASGQYPGWTPNPDSPLLALCQRAYAREFGGTARPQVIHAGLECGLLAASHPGLDMISFGPDIRGAHAPGERAEIASVARCWTLLKAVLAELARPEGGCV
jgi:dipeptidase D